MIKYRIVRDKVFVRDEYRIMYIAQRRVHFLGLIFWWPVMNAKWRHTHEEAERDADYDMLLRTDRHVEDYDPE